MGLSVAVSGSLIMFALVLVMMNIPTFADKIFLIEDARTKMSNLDNSVSRTNISLSSLEASAGSPLINFTLNNEGKENIWNFEKATLIVTYQTTNGKLTELLAYDSDCLGGIPSTAHWCVQSISNDILNPGILDNGENAIVRTQLSQNLNGGAAVIFTTDIGTVTTTSTL